MNTEYDPTTDRLAYALRSLLQSCNQTNISSNQTTGINTGGIQLDFTYAVQTDSSTVQEKRSFVKFLQVHTNHAFVKGFDDSLGRNTSRAHFEMPSVDIWFQVANQLYKLFCDVNEESSVRGLSALNIDTRFSEQRCLKVLPLAVARYQENLPPHYTRSYHESRVIK